MLVQEIVEQSHGFYNNKNISRLQNVMKDIYEMAVFDSGYSLYTDESCEVVLYEEMLDGLSESYIHEVIVKQAEEGSLNAMFSQEEAIKAMSSEEEYNDLFEMIGEFLDYNNSFGVYCGGLEFDFLEDATNVMSNWQLFYLKQFEDSEGFLDGRDTFQVYGESFVAINSPLQEVW